VFKLGLQIGVVELGCSSLGVQVGVSGRVLWILGFQLSVE
jgi:hypothetical protein